MATVIYMALNEEVFETTLEKENSTEAGKEALKYWGYYLDKKDAEIKLKQNIAETERLLKHREKILESNKCFDILEENGFLCCGVTNNLKQVAILKAGKWYYFKDYTEAAKELIK